MGFDALTADDVRDYGALLKARGLKPKTVAYNLSTLGLVCSFCGNPAVALAKARYPMLFYFPRRTRYPPLSDGQVKALVATVADIPDDAPFSLHRGAMATMLALGAGLRMVEMYNLAVKDLSLADATVNVRLTKGQGSYGLERVAPINPATLPYMWRYVAIRSNQPPTARLSPFLLPSQVTGDMVVGNTLRRDRLPIVEAVGFDYDFRALRRTFAQSAIDLGADIEAVSVVMGHHSTKTTEAYYGRLNPLSALEKVKGVWR